MHPRGGWHDHDWRGLRKAGATFAEIERQIEMPKSYCCLPFQSREVLASDWQFRFKRRGNCGSVFQNLCLTESAEPRSETVLGQARCILTNQHDTVQHFFTRA
jgi:hypothetical protein